jgi:ankyrin repeat protein
MPTINEQLFHATNANNAQLIGELIRGGADVNAKDHKGRTPLHVAAENNHLNAARKLWLYNANIDSRRNNHFTPIMDAVVCGHETLVRFFIRKGARLDISDGDKWHVLHWVAEKDHTSIAKLIIQYAPCLVNRVRYNGLAPLHLVQSPAMAKLFLDNGADIDVVTDQGETVLHIATKNKKSDLIKCLLQYEANPLKQDKRKKSAVTLATANKSDDVLKLFSKKSASRSSKPCAQNKTIALSKYLVPTDAHPDPAAPPEPVAPVEPTGERDPEIIIEHAQRRVDLFFYTLIAYYNSGLKARIADTHFQHGIGQGKLKTHACHSAILPGLWDTVHISEESTHRTSLLDGTHLQQSLNSTVELHCSVNYFDSHYVEGKKADDKMRSASLLILNRVSKGTINPIQGMIEFLSALRLRFDTVKTAYLTHRALQTSPQQTRAFIFNCQEKGSFHLTLDKNMRNGNLLLNHRYIHMILFLDRKELQSAFEPLKSAFEQSTACYLKALENLHEKAYALIKQDMGIPAYLCSKKGMFSVSHHDLSMHDSACQNVRLKVPN